MNIQKILEEKPGYEWLGKEIRDLAKAWSGGGGTARVYSLTLITSGFDEVFETVAFKGAAEALGYFVYPGTGCIVTGEVVDTHGGTPWKKYFLQFAGILKGQPEPCERCRSTLSSGDFNGMKERDGLDRCLGCGTS